MKEFELTIKIVVFASTKEQARECALELQHGRLKTLNILDVNEVKSEE